MDKRYPLKDALTRRRQQVQVQGILGTHVSTTKPRLPCTCKNYDAMRSATQCHHAMADFLLSEKSQVQKVSSWNHTTGSSIPWYPRFKKGDCVHLYGEYKAPMREPAYTSTNLHLEASQSTCFLTSFQLHCHVPNSKCTPGSQVWPYYK